MYVSKLTRTGRKSDSGHNAKKLIMIIPARGGMIEAKGVMPFMRCGENRHVLLFRGHHPASRCRLPSFFPSVFPRSPSPLWKASSPTLVPSQLACKSSLARESFFRFTSWDPLTYAAVLKRPDFASLGLKAPPGFRPTHSTFLTTRIHRSMLVAKISTFPLWSRCSKHGHKG